MIPLSDVFSLKLSLEDFSMASIGCLVMSKRAMDRMSTSCQHNVVANQRPAGSWLCPHGGHQWKVWRDRPEVGQDFGLAAREAGGSADLFKAMWEAFRVPNRMRRAADIIRLDMAGPSFWNAAQCFYNLLAIFVPARAPRQTGPSFCANCRATSFTAISTVLACWSTV